MIADKDEAEWASTTYSQGAGETDWKEYQTELTFVGRSIVFQSTLNSVTTLEEQPNGIIVNNSGTLTGINTPTGLAGFRPNTIKSYTAESNSFSLYFNYMDISSDGRYLFAVLQTPTNSVRRYTLSTPGDITTINTTSDQSWTIPVGTGITGGLRISKDGTKLFYSVQSTNTLYQHSLSTPWDLSTISVSATSTLVFADSGVSDICFTDDGKYLYVIGSTRNLRKYNLTNLWSVASIGTNTVLFCSDISGTTFRLLVSPSKTTILIFLYGSTVCSAYFISDPSYTIANAFFDTSQSTSTPFPQSTYSATKFGNKIFHSTTISSVHRVYESTGLPVNHVKRAGSVSYTTSVDISLSGADTVINDVIFSKRGHKFYIISDGNNRVTQFNLTTPWSINTASMGSQITLAAGTATAIFISDDGLKLYVGVSSIVYEYRLSTPWDLTSATDSGRSFTAANSIQSIAFSTDGTKLFVTHSNSVFRYPLTTPWNLSTVGTSNENIYVGVGNGTVTTFSKDGALIYIIGYNSQLYQIRLKEAWTLSQNGGGIAIGSTGDLTSGNVASNTGAAGITLSRDGTNIYAVSNSRIYQRTITIGSDGGFCYNYMYDITIANLAAAPTNVYQNTAKQWSLLTASETVLNTLTSTITPVSATVGSATLSFDNTVDPVFETYDYVTITPSLAPNVSTLSYSNSSGSPPGVSSYSGTGIKLSPDGTKLFVVQSNAIFKYDLNSAWSITNIPTATTSKVILSPLNNIRDITFSPDGTKLFTITGTNVVVQYDLPSAWDISSFSSTTQLTIAGAVSALQGIEFSADGTRMFVIRDGSSIATYTLSTPYTISTATVLNTFTLTNASTLSLRFSLNGRKMYLLRTSSIDQYNLSTAWNPATATYIGTFSINMQTANANGLDIHTEGNKFYVMSDSPTVYQYNSSDSLVTQTAQINSISVANSQTTINFTEQLYPVYVAVSGRSAAQPGVQFEFASGNVTVKSDKIALPNGKRFAKVKITGDYGDDIVNAKLNLWKA